MKHNFEPKESGTPEFTQEQEVEIQKRIEAAKREAILLEQLTIAEDTIRRDLIIRAEQMVAQGVWHPFLKDVAKTMYSAAIPQQKAVVPEEPKGDPTGTGSDDNP